MANATVAKSGLDVGPTLSPVTNSLDHCGVGPANGEAVTTEVPPQFQGLVYALDGEAVVDFLGRLRLPA